VCDPDSQLGSGARFTLESDIASIKNNGINPSYPCGAGTTGIIQFAVLLILKMTLPPNVSSSDYVNDIASRVMVGMVNNPCVQPFVVVISVQEKAIGYSVGNYILSYFPASKLSSLTTSANAAWDPFNLQAVPTSILNNMQSTIELANKPTQTSGSLPTGAVVGIVVGIVLCTGIFAAALQVVRMRAQSSLSVGSNPLYEAPRHGGANPLMDTS